MQPTQRPISLAHKAAYSGLGGLVLFIVESLAIYYGISDGSLLFVAPLLISPFLGIAGIVLGTIALKRHVQPRRLAIIGVASGWICVALIATILIYAALWVTAWYGA